MRTRILLLILILLAFARLLYHLDFNTMWWDESLSLVRAELDWPALLRGDMRFSTGLFAAFTPDQHPFLYFALLKISTVLLGKSEFALRYPSVLCSVLIVPTLWALGRLLERRRFAPSLTGPIAATLAAFHPFYLWYGQEIRHYSLWSLLAILYTYTLLDWLEFEKFDTQPAKKWPLIRYIIVFALLIVTHYYSVLVLPVHLLVILLYFGRRDPRRTTLIVLPLFLIGAVGFAYIIYSILNVGGAADNNARITANILLPDLLNSYSLGPTSDIAQLWWLLLLFAVLALLGSLYMLRNRALLAQGGWILPLSVITPPVLILLITVIIPAYQTSRHLALISGPFIALVAGGLAIVWQHWRGTLAKGLLALMLGGMLYSSYTYFTEPQARFSDLRSMGHTLRQRMLPGDLLLLYPPEYFRSFEYYLPLDQISQTQNLSKPTAWEVVPLGTAAKPDQSLDAWLREKSQQYDRIWLADGGNILLRDPQKQVLAWAKDHLFLFNQYGFASVASDLDIYLFYPAAPIITDTTFIPPNALRMLVSDPNQAEIELRGYEVGQPINQGFPYPVTLYWRAVVKPQVRYHYILELVQLDSDGRATVLGRTEREPFYGGAPTIWWDPGQFIVEASDIEVPSPGLAKAGQYQLRLQIYRGDTLEKQILRLDQDNSTVINPTASNPTQLDPLTIALPVSFTN